jgi:hypothetical protein
LGFDFHLTAAGPKLIEINTNAGGLATVFHLSGCPEEKAMMTAQFQQAILEEWALFTNAQTKQREGRSGIETPAVPSVAIVDDNAEEQGLYLEMLLFADVLRMRGMFAVVCSPQELQWRDDCLVFVRKHCAEHKIDLVYNRIAPDFRLQDDGHKALRQALLHGSVCVTPHPAAYSHIADKRLLQALNGKSPLVPLTCTLADRTVEEWAADKKRWVFKPPEGNGSRGVYRGDKVSQAVLKQLPPSTIAQELCPPATEPSDVPLGWSPLPPQHFYFCTLL